MKNIKKHPKALKSHFFILLFSLFSLTLVKAQFEPWCFEAIEDDYEAAEEFMNSISVSAAPDGEIDIPLHIIYVYEDDGTPPGSGTRWSEVIPDVNSYFDGFLNFYICGYHHIVSSELTDFTYATEKQTLYNTYHVDDAINIYIVRYSDRTRAEFPWNTLNNAVWVVGGTDGRTLAHELGHYFGLFHTHNVIYQDPSHCFLQSPSTDIDQVSDTNYDPGPTSYCTVDCPTISSCTLTCNVGSTVTYTYTDIPTGNIMSYHNCPDPVFSSGQIDRMRVFLMSHSNRTFLLTAPNACNNNIAEDGFVTKYCNSSLSGEDIDPIKDINVQALNETTSYLNTSSGSDLGGKYEVFPSNFSNISTVTLMPKRSNAFITSEHPELAPDNYQPLNGVTTGDLVLIQKHILSIAPLNGPYSMIAADANKSGGITTFDIVTIRKVLLGIDRDYIAGTWRFVPEHYFTNSTFASGFATSPFGAHYGSLGYADYMDKITLDMDDDIVAETNPWSFRAVKVGDVNCTFVPDDFSPSDDDLISLASNNSNCVYEDDIITVDVYGASSSDLIGYQLGLGYNTDDLQYLGVSTGNLADFSQDNFANSSGAIKAMWLKNNGQAEDLSTPKTLFKLHFKVLNDFCNIQDELNLSTSVLPNFAYDEDGESTSATVAFVYQATTPDGRVTSVSPNPSTTSVTFGFQLNTTATVDIRLSDYLGNTLTNAQSYSSGTNSYTFSSLSSLTSGALNYSVKINGVTYSGILIKS